MGRFVSSAALIWLLVSGCWDQHVLAAGWDCANKDREGRWVCGSNDPLVHPLKTQEAADSGVELGEEPSVGASDDPLNNPDSGDKTGAEDRPGLLNNKIVAGPARSRAATLVALPMWSASLVR